MEGKIISIPTHYHGAALNHYIDHLFNDKWYSRNDLKLIFNSLEFAKAKEYKKYGKMSIDEMLDIMFAPIKSELPHNCGNLNQLSL